MLFELLQCLNELNNILFLFIELALLLRHDFSEFAELLLHAVVSLQSFIEIFGLLPKPHYLLLVFLHFVPILLVFRLKFVKFSCVYLVLLVFLDVLDVQLQIFYGLVLVVKHHVLSIESYLQIFCSFLQLLHLFFPII